MKEDLVKVIKRALEEDIGSGDITTLAAIRPDVMSEGKFLIKEDGIIAGINVVELVLKNLDPQIDFNTTKKDGDVISKGVIAGIVKGKAQKILSGERTALNFLQRMSGIATLTNEYVQKINHTKAKILDTRKTAPGLRLLDKKAVEIGGGNNHRVGLYDMFMVKDNHIKIAGSISKAVEACKMLRSKSRTNCKIEVETKNLNEVKDALACDVDIIMLDNFNIDEMSRAVKIINGNCLVEASGNVSLDNVKSIAETGVDYISVGALTHSVKAQDISLELEFE